jgi:hypothetical protein
MTALSCEWRARLVDERLLNADGVCPSCADPDNADFERHYGAYLETYKSHSERRSRSAVASYEDACLRCGQTAERTVGVTHRNGGTRYVCEDCQGDALSGDRSFWHWFHKE